MRFLVASTGRIFEVVFRFCRCACWYSLLSLWAFLHHLTPLNIKWAIPYFRNPHIRPVCLFCAPWSYEYPLCSPMPCRGAQPNMTHGSAHVDFFHKWDVLEPSFLPFHSTYHRYTSESIHIWHPKALHKARFEEHAERCSETDLPFIIL